MAHLMAACCGPRSERSLSEWRKRKTSTPDSVSFAFRLIVCYCSLVKMPVARHRHIEWWSNETKRYARKLKDFFILILIREWTPKPLLHKHTHTHTQSKWNEMILLVEESYRNREMNIMLGFFFHLYHRNGNMFYIIRCGTIKTTNEGHDDE